MSFMDPSAFEPGNIDVASGEAGSVLSEGFNLLTNIASAPTVSPEGQIEVANAITPKQAAAMAGNLGDRVPQGSGHPQYM